MGKHVLQALAQVVIGSAEGGPRGCVANIEYEDALAGYNFIKGSKDFPGIGRIEFDKAAE